MVFHKAGDLWDIHRYHLEIMEHLRWEVLVLHLLQTAVTWHLAVDQLTSQVTNMEHHFPHRVASIYFQVNRVDNTEPHQLPLLPHHQATNTVLLHLLARE